MINTDFCIGCQACAEICPTHAIVFSRDIWGEGKAAADANKCIECGLCERICPGIHAEFNEIPETVSAVVSEKHRSTGSSGGVFFEIASRFIEDGGAVYGAAFDDELKLIHKRAETQRDLIPLCKSKYIHSDMSGIYLAVRNDLKNGKKVLFVGTPCQASAVKSLFFEQYKEQLYVADFLCHGTGTQRIFDACIHEEEKKCGGRITDFCFRAKSRKAEHSFSYTLDNGKKQKTVSGYDFEFPYYYSFLKYTIFNDACYSCPYAQNARVGDITLGDFWGIQRYNHSLKDWQGVSMLAVNSEKGRQLFDSVKGSCRVYDYPLSTASRHNQSYNEPEPYPPQKRKLVEILEKGGEAELVRTMACPNLKKSLVWVRIPVVLRKIYKKLRGGV